MFSPTMKHLPRTATSALATTLLVLGCGGPEIDELIGPFRTELAQPPFGVVDGRIEPPHGPGLGIQIDETMLERYPAIAGPCYLPIERSAGPTG